MSSSQQALISVTVDGRPLGVFDTRTGGGTTSEVSKRRSGGMGPIKQYRSLPNYEDVTVSRVAENERDHELARWLDTRVGRAEAVVSEQPLDENGSAWGRPRTWVGTLMAANPPGRDSESAEAVLYELVVQVRSKA